MSRPLLAAALGTFALLAVYFTIVTLVSGWEFALQQARDSWVYLIILSVGFGAQVGLFVEIRKLARGRDGSGRVVAVSASTSTVAMISCCTHYTANLLPLLGTIGIVTIASQYQKELFWIGIAFNLSGVAYLAGHQMLLKKHVRAA